MDDVDKIMEDAERELLTQGIELKNIRDENKRKDETRILSAEERDAILEKFKVNQESDDDREDGEFLNRNLTQEKVDELTNKMQGDEEQSENEIVNIETLFQQEGQEFDKHLLSVVSKDLKGAHAFLKNIVNGEKEIDNKKVSALQNTINQVAEQKITEEILSPPPVNSGDCDFKDRIDDIISSINPELAQSIMENILKNSYTNDDIPNYEFKILSLQESIREAMKTKEKNPITITQETAIAKQETQKVVQEIDGHTYLGDLEHKDTSQNQVTQAKSQDKLDDGR